MSYADAFRTSPTPVADSYYGTGAAGGVPTTHAFYGVGAYCDANTGVPTTRGYYGANGSDDALEEASHQDGGMGDGGMGDGGMGGGGMGGGGMGGGDASGAGAVMAAIAPIIDGVVNAVSVGVETESTPKMMAKGNANRFAKNLKGLKRVVAEARNIQRNINRKKRKRDKVQGESDAVQKMKADWLRNPSKKKQWRSSNRAPGVPGTPQAGKTSAPGAIWCEPLYEGLSRKKNPGGTVKGLTTTWCPSHDTAYKDAAKARIYKEEIKFARTTGGGLMPASKAKYDRLTNEINVLQTRLEAVQYTRPPLEGAGGNITAIRSRALKNWGMLMGIRAYAPLLRLAPPGSDGPEMLMFAPDETTLIGEETMGLLFPENVDVKCGRLPFQEAAKHLTLYLNLYNDPRTRFFDDSRGRWTSMMANQKPPLWALGLTEAEQRIVGLAPPLWLLELLAQQGTQVTQEQVLHAAELSAAQGGFESGGVGYGAVDYNYYNDAGSNYGYAAVFGGAPAHYGLTQKEMANLAVGLNPDGSERTNANANVNTNNSSTSTEEWVPQTSSIDSGPKGDAQSTTSTANTQGTTSTANSIYDFKIESAQDRGLAAGTPLGFVRSDGKVWDGSAWKTVTLYVPPVEEGSVPEDDCSPAASGEAGGFLWNLRQALLGLDANTLADWEKVSPQDDAPPHYNDGNDNREAPKGKGLLLAGLAVAGLGAALLWPG